MSDCRLPPLSQCKHDLTALSNALGTLLEAFPSLSLVATQVSQSQELQNVATYADLVELSFATLATWPPATKAEFISGHPRIGEIKNLSALSEKEQAATATPPEVIVRLERLNCIYERRFPGLRYITFVNGRARQAIAEELEQFLALQGVEVVASETAPPEVQPLDAGNESWTQEVERAVADVKLIAQSRLRAMGVE